MSLIQFVYLYLLTIPVFFLIDMVWLGVVAKNLYQSAIGHLLGPVQWVPAIIFYLIYIVGILIFAVAPGLESGSLTKTLMYAALFGFFAYATYDLTNLATLKGWPLSIALIDILWGVVLTSLVATASYGIARQLFF